ncbi:hypothetical protein BCR43DRAFT_517641 [Syncephalastrum racemosum]|uniref:Uncharacterized protein n=1 Tax=Syncephalastrum racemosum TaxID=13706 RepID=A0A1X2H510_SYNRA|nr:hypothetical protein BCR43DRAFT_517641 [Syncephalastrum racemosum]
MTHPTPVPEPDSFNSRCGDRGNMDTICSPKPSQNWKNGSWHQIQWNPSYPSYAQASSVNIYLYYVENYHSTLIKNWSNVSPSQGEYAVQVDDSWFLLTQETKNSALIYLLPSNMDPATELQNRHSAYPKPVSFFIENASIGSNPQTNQSSAEQTDNSDNEVLRPWAIALIVLASIAATVALAVLLCLLRQVQRRKQLVYDEKDGGMVDSDVPSIAIAAPKQDWNAAPPHHISGSINPPTFSQYMASSSLVVPDSSTMYLRPQSTSNISSRSEGPPLTSNEAIMLADSFRQQMRQPDWQRQPQAQLEDDSEQRRRTLSEELLKKELAAEGTLMKKVGKRAHMLSSIQFQDQQQQQEQVEYQYQRQQDETVGDSSSVRRARSRSNSSHHSSVIQSK